MLLLAYYTRPQLIDFAISFRYGEYLGLFCPFYSMDSDRYGPCPEGFGASHEDISD